MSIQTRKKESRLRTEEGVSTALPPKPRQSQIEESGIRSKKDMVRKSNHFEGELMEEPVSFMPQQPQHAVEEPKVEFNRSESEMSDASFDEDQELLPPPIPPQQSIKPAVKNEKLVKSKESIPEPTKKEPPVP